MAPDAVPDTASVVHQFIENRCQVTTVADPADPPHTLYGTVTRDGSLVGSYHCADPARRTDWRIVTAHGGPLILDGHPVNPVSEAAAVLVLTTILTARDSFEAEQRLRAATLPPSAMVR
ncbi:hypothetical protein [Actinokineospora sp. HUAS TT18]|uniref:hypothetical protein n=1 Tax=Actinokineospora sp. HUAS TT18 TaxID=3447451 RepID=UPI003F525117